MTAYERIRNRRGDGITEEERQANQNTDAMFWGLTSLGFLLFLAVGVWKYFYFQTQISAPILFWERFLEFSAAGASEAFRFGSLIMAYYESKKGRFVTVWFGILVSVGIMMYDIHLGALVASPETVETYIFLCLVSELVGIRAVFGYAFEDVVLKLNGQIETLRQGKTKHKKKGVSRNEPAKVKVETVEPIIETQQSETDNETPTAESNGFDETRAKALIETNGLSATTLRTWKRRGSIPAKYL